MKLFLSVATTALLAGGARAVNLRAATAREAAVEGTQSSFASQAASQLAKKNKRKKGKKYSPSSDSDDPIMHGHLQIGHVLDVSSADAKADIDLIESAFVNAYNNANPNGKYEVTSMTLEREVVIPEDLEATLASIKGENVGQLRPGVFIDWYYFFGFHCRLCRDDDDYAALSATELPVLEASAHRVFEDQFCLTLHQSGLEEYSALADCSILFDYDGDGNDIDSGDQLELQKKNKRKNKKKGKKKHANNDEVMDGRLLIGHVLDLSDVDSQAEIELIQTAFVDSYNGANPEGKYELTSMILDRERIIPEDLEGAIATIKGENVGQLRPGVYIDWYYFFGFHCRLCRDDDDYAALSATELPTLSVSAHRIFEEKFCISLKDSGLTEYSEISECSIIFGGDSTYENIIEEKKQMLI